MSSPTLDLFFFTHDDQYVWSLTMFTFVADGIISIQDFLPLRPWPFDGFKVAVVNRVRNVVETILKNALETCVSRTRKEYEEYASVPCAELKEIYPMYGG